jgi:hypothetical protein
MALPSLSAESLPAICEDARPTSDSQENQLRKYHFHRQADGTYSTILTKQSIFCLRTVILFFEEELKGIAVNTHR